MTAFHSQHGDEPRQAAHTLPTQNAARSSLGIFPNGHRGPKAKERSPCEKAAPSPQMHDEICSTHRVSHTNRIYRGGKNDGMQTGRIQWGVEGEGREAGQTREKQETLSLVEREKHHGWNGEKHEIIKTLLEQWPSFSWNSDFTRTKKGFQMIIIHCLLKR